MELTNLKFAKILWILITGLIRKVFVDKVLTIANYSMPFQNDLRVATKVPKTSKNLENNLYRLCLLGFSLLWVAVVPVTSPTFSIVTTIFNCTFSSNRSLVAALTPSIRTDWEALSSSSREWTVPLQLNLHQTELLFWYVFHNLTWNCLLISEDLPGFTSSCICLLLKLFYTSKFQNKNNFVRSVLQIFVNPGKSSEINKQFHVK